jgi:tetratricopeptide (TPR) repeat protein
MTSDLEEALRGHPFVVVVGESTAGKTRLAFQAVQSSLPDHWFVQPDPDDRSSLRAARMAVVRRGRSVIWLDDLERYLGAGGLTAHSLRQMIHAGRDVVVIATIRAQESARYSGLNDGGDAADDRRVGRSVLELAHEIRLDRRWSDTEIGRARVCSDRRIADALAHSGRYGVAEYLAAGPQLLAAAENAWAPEGRHTRGAALVAGAIDARRAGWHRPLPIGLLRELHEHQLTARGGAMLRPEPWDDAMAWATTPLYAISSLLSPDERHEDCYQVFDYLPDAIDAADENRPLLEATWTVLITCADGPTCLDIGWKAYRRRQWEIADGAFRKAMNSGIVLGATGLAMRLGETGQLQQAADLLRTALSSAPADTDPAELLEVRSDLSWWTGAAGNVREALETSEDVWNASRKLYGDEHPFSLHAARILARWTGHMGHTDEALRIALAAQERSIRAFGPDDRTTLASRFEVAAWSSGGEANLDEAIRLWRELDIDATRVLGEFSTTTNDARWNLADLMIANGDIQDGLRLLDSVAAGRTVIYGDNHPRTLEGRLQLAGETGRAGNVTRAVEMARAVTNDSTRHLGAEHELTLYGQYQIALWTALLGDTDQAKALFSALLAQSSRILGPDHKLTHDTREQLRQVPGHSINYHLPASW